ncbi:hypothetical protein HDV02_004077 [Globomyces sp. JEL0801]|nr:hypothetical protein HDV02_004077 [Globomyces sp. JEL0801]
MKLFPFGMDPVIEEALVGLREAREELREWKVANQPLNINHPTYLELKAVFASAQQTLVELKKQQVELSKQQTSVELSKQQTLVELSKQQTARITVERDLLLNRSPTLVTKFPLSTPSIHPSEHSLSQTENMIIYHFLNINIIVFTNKYDNKEIIPCKRFDLEYKLLEENEDFFYSFKDNIMNKIENNLIVSSSASRLNIMDNDLSQLLYETISISVVVCGKDIWYFESPEAKALIESIIDWNSKIPSDAHLYVNTVFLPE